MGGSNINVVSTQMDLNALLRKLKKGFLLFWSRRRSPNLKLENSRIILKNPITNV